MRLGLIRFLSLFLCVFILLSCDTYALGEVAYSLSANDALQLIKDGNKRFFENKTRNHDDTRKDVQRLMNEQHPHTIVLSCSDSRVPPEIVFDQKLGEIFTVRSAGESPDISQIASIEYAVEHLGVHLIIVLGHTQCGAVHSALAKPSELKKETPAIRDLVHSIRKRIPIKKHPSPLLHDESQANARGIALELLRKSRFLKTAVTNGSLSIKSGLYHLADGHVEWDN